MQPQENDLAPLTKTKKKRFRTQYVSSQLLALENLFKSKSYISKYERTLLAQQLELNDRQIKIWFQNRRMKAKKEEKTTEATIPKVLSTSSDASLPTNSTNVVFSNINNAIEFQQLGDPYNSNNWNQNQNSVLTSTETIPPPYVNHLQRSIWSTEENLELQNNYNNLQEILNYQELSSSFQTNLLDTLENTFVSRAESLCASSSSSYEDFYLN